MISKLSDATVPSGTVLLYFLETAANGPFLGMLGWQTEYPILET